jgi:diphthine synthase
MALYIVGLGIYKYPCIPLEILELISDIDVAYLEKYTSPIDIDPDKLAKILGIKRIIILERRDLEDKSTEIIKKALDKDIVILVPGDPLIATTHTSLIIDARKIGVDTKVIHSSSALCAAIGESGLHTYKFGPYGTIIRKEKGSSKRCYDILVENLERGLHTLFFLEYDYETNYIMTPREAIEILKSYDEKDILKEDRLIIILCGLGSKYEFKRAYTISELKGMEQIYLDRPCIIIFPGELHFTEREYIELILRGHRK